MEIKCIAIDDEPLALKQMETYIQKTPFLKLIGSCRNAFEAMELIAKESIDLIFADIHMPDLSGMDFIKSLEKPIPVIFTTAYAEHAVEGFKVNATDYLLKPISYIDFLKSANKAREQITQTLIQKPDSTSGHIFVKSGYKLVKINLEEILFIEGMQEYANIHLEDSSKIMTLKRLKNFETELPDNFLRIHRSYIINMDKINEIERNMIYFKGLPPIPVSKGYMDVLNQYLSDKHSL